MMDLEVDRLWNKPVILDREGVQDAGRSASGIRRCSCITNLKIVDRCGSKAFNCQMDSLFQPTSAQSRSLASFERLLERTAP